MYHFVSGFIDTGYLLFERNYLVIFILVSVFCLVYSLVYSEFVFSQHYAVCSRWHFVDF